MAFEPVTREELRIGLYIKIEGSWFSHPFPTNTFKIRYQKEVETLCGLKHVKLFYDPDRSDPIGPHDTDAVDSAVHEAQEFLTSSAHPDGPQNSDSPETVAGRSMQEEAIADLVQRKRELQNDFRSYQRQLERIEAEYKEVLRQGKTMLHEIGTKQARGLKTAATIIESVNRLLADPGSSSAVMNLIGSMGGSEEFSFHAINVCMLSLLIGRGVRLNPRDLDRLALGALFHDIGELKYSMETLLKKAPSSVVETDAVLRKHPKYGREMLMAFPQFPIEALDIIAQHHERLDGSGYPLGLKAESIAPLAKIVMVADEYDELCHAPDPTKSLIPSEALSYLYAKRRRALCQDAIVTLIRLLGVYPPGSIVRLSNEAYALVTSVNVQARLRPVSWFIRKKFPEKKP